MDEKMFCYQCEQTAQGTGCTKVGVCGKSPEVSALQDILTHALKGLALYAVEGRKVGIVDREVNVFTAKALFSTLTNVDFDAERFPPLIDKCVDLREGLKKKVEAAGGSVDFAANAGTVRACRNHGRPDRARGRCGIRANGRYRCRYSISPAYADSGSPGSGGVRGPRRDSRTGRRRCLCLLARRAGSDIEP